MPTTAQKLNIRFYNAVFGKLFAKIRFNKTTIQEELMSKVKRVYVEKKQPYAVKAKELTEDIKGYLGINTLDAVRVLVRYDVENLSEDTYKKALTTVFSEPPVDNVYEENFPFNETDRIFSVEYLPGQFDQPRQGSGRYHRPAR